MLGASQRRLVSTVERLPVTCRRSGGGAVLLGPWLVNVAVRLPTGHPLAALDVRSAACWLGDVHLAAFERLGIEAARAEEPGLELVRWACFGGVTRGELVVGGRKLTGIAQERRRAGVVLVAGTLVTPPDWGLLCEAMGSPGEATLLAASTISCAELAPVPPPAGAFAAALATQLGAEQHVSRGARHDFFTKLSFSHAVVYDDAPTVHRPFS